jgi:predicted metal-dependent hydrolase
MDFDATERFEEERERYEDDLRYLQARFKDLTRQIEHAKEKPNGTPVNELEAERGRAKRALERVRGRLRNLDAEIGHIERRIDLRFHPYWGSLLKEGAEQSSFGAQVEEYACLYTARVSNFLSYSPQQYFRSPRDVMAHEIGA